MDLLLILGAIAAILTFILNIMNIYLAVKRTNMQADLHRWKKEHIKRKKSECGDPKHKEI